MSKDDLQKTLIGSLLIGVGLLSGNATLITVAAGVGVNWTSEGLSGLWTEHVGPKLTTGSPLSQAYAHSLRRAVRDLRESYKSHVDPQSDLAAFNLLAETAGSVAQAQYPDNITSVPAAQEVLARALKDLLHGHDPRQVDYITRHLLEATATAFQSELPADPSAWNQFHGWLVQQIARQMSQLSQSLASLPEVLAHFQDPARVLQTVDDASNEIKAEIRALAEEMRRLVEQSGQSGSSGATVFKTGEIVADQFEGVAGHRYVNVDPADVRRTSPVDAPPTAPAGVESVFDIKSIRAGKATLVGGSQFEKTSGQPSPATTRTILALFANAQDTNQLALLHEARVLRNIIEDVRDSFHLELLPAGTVDDLGQALLRYRPSLLHFSGHGGPDGLLFERGEGQSQLVPRAALVRELSAFAPRLQCVVLNACHSESHIDTGFALGIPFVISMRGPIDDPSAIEFTRGFYEALAVHSEVSFAYERGCNRVRLKEFPGAEVPQLWHG